MLSILVVAPKKRNGCYFEKKKRGKLKKIAKLDLRLIVNFRTPLGKVRGQKSVLMTEFPQYSMYSLRHGCPQQYPTSLQVQSSHILKKLAAKRAKGDVW